MRWLRPVVLVVLAGSLTFTGCRSPGTPSADRSSLRLPAGASATAPATGSFSGVPPSTSALPADGFDVATQLSPYGGPPPGSPPSAGPPTTLQAAVDLTSAADGALSTVVSAVATPDGGAYVVLRPDDAGLPLRLAAVRPVGGHFSVTGSAPIPVSDAWGTHLLADGKVVVTGPLRAPGDDDSSYGFVVVDPRTGTGRTTVVVPFRSRSEVASGRSALGPDGRTLYLAVFAVTGTGPQQRLVAVDGMSGTVLRDRDLSRDVSTASGAPIGHDVAGLVSRPRGGVTLVFDAIPDGTDRKRIPTLLSYDAQLTPAGGPRRATGFAEEVRTQAVASGIDGTVFLVVALTGAAWVLAVPDGGGAGPVLVEILESSAVPALVVEPAQVWGLLPTPAGARAVDLTSGTVSPPVDLGCPAQDVRAVFPGSGGTGALLIGECNSSRPGTETLWIVRP